ncbi:MAG: aldo/keto reductase [Treponema sp.]|nr:aldo/keto reductase [Treponema sp.]
MQYRKDKKSGNELSVLGFGCMRFPRKGGRHSAGSQNFSAIDLKKTEQLLMEAVEQGVNYFDTAYLYPKSEESVGTVFEKNNVREKVYIATKLPLIFCHNRNDFDRFFTKSLDRLKTSYIDYFLLHMLTNFNQWEQLRAWGVESWITEQKKLGKIRYIGFSYHGSLQEFLKIIDSYPWEFTQIQYNYSDENFQAGITGLKKAAETMPVIIMEPLLGGKLATGLPEKAVQLFKNANPTLSPAAWALNWIWNQIEATVILSGMNTLEQLHENVQTANNAVPGLLSTEDMTVFQKVREVLNSTYKIHCTGCNYCMPCSHGVNIPACFSAYNTSFALGMSLGMQQYTTSTAVTSKQTHGASLCTKCGACETHCPQHLPIREHLEQVRKRMEPWWFRFGVRTARIFLGHSRAKNS